MDPSLSQARDAHGTRWGYYLVRPWRAAAVLWRYHFWPRFSAKAVPLAGVFWKAAQTGFASYQAVAERPERRETLLVFSDDKHLDLLLENLWTLAKSWRTLPKLLVVGDFNSKETNFRAALKWWPHSWHFVPYEQIEETFNGEGRAWLSEFGRHHIFGRKLAAVLYSARRSPTLYCDSDVLWLSEPAFLDEVKDDFPILLGSMNPYPSYYEEMIEASCAELMKPPFTCAGLLYISQWPWPEEVLKEWVSRAMKLPPHGLAEQTIIGFLVRHFGSYIPDTDIALYTSDRDCFLPVTCRPGWSARHYVTPVRYHFYRDALLMRLGILHRADNGISSANGTNVLYHSRNVPVDKEMS